MKVPGFIAEASLYRNRAYYRTSGYSNEADGFAGLAQLGRIRFDPSLLIDARPPVPSILKTDSWMLGEGCQLVWQGSPTGRTELKCHTDWQYRPAFPLSECPGADKS